MLIKSHKLCSVVAGLLPRVGLGRAIGLALRSKIFPMSLHTVSQRTAEVGKLKTAVERLAPRIVPNYIVVTGPIGSGKSTVVKTALSRTCGVVRITGYANTTEMEVVKAALAEVAGTSEFYYLDPHLNAARVLFFYNLLLPRPPIVIINVYGGGSHTAASYSGITAGAQWLAKLGYRVIIDASTNDLPDRLLNIRRQEMLTIEPMSLEVMETVPEFRRTIDLLKDLDRFQLVWATCGGNPALMVLLMGKLRLRGAHFTHPEGRLTAESARELGAAVDAFALERVGQAIGRQTRLVVRHPHLKELLAMFQTVDIVYEDVISKKRFVRPDIDYVLRAVDSSGAVIPADAAMALVLRHGLMKKPTIEELRKLVGEVRYSSDILCNFGTW